MEGRDSPLSLRPLRVRWNRRPWPVVLRCAPTAITSAPPWAPGWT